MRKTLLCTLSLTACMVLAASGVAWAHVEVAPEEVAPGDYETLTVSVPTEKDIPTTKVRVEVPEGFILSGVQPVPGWDHSFEEDGGVITAVTWSGGELEPREFQQFLLQVQAPEEPGEYPWRAFQTYEDGSVVEWTGPPEAEEPASVVEVVSGGAGSHEHGSHSEAAPSGGTLPDSGGTNLVLYAGFGGAVLALAALLAQRRRS